MNRQVLAIALLVAGLGVPPSAAACACVAFLCFDEVATRRPVVAHGRVRRVSLRNGMSSADSTPPQGARHALTGSVIDQTQAFVPKADVALTDSSRGKKRKTRSDGLGQFKFDGLPPGEYEMAVTRPGFKPSRSRVSISGRDVEQDVYLEIGGLTETVVITRAQVVRPASEIRTYPRQEPPPCEPATERPIGGNILPPTKIRDVRPTYPHFLKTSGIRGRVVVTAAVGTDGRVSDIVVVGQVRQEFADAARDAIAQWLFDPVYLNCRPLAMRLTVDVEFTDNW